MNSQVSNLIAARREAPLAFAQLWHRDGTRLVDGKEVARTSQRDSIRALLEPGKLFAFLLGGNRSGKSEGGAQLLVAYALGREHPWTKAWCTLNGIDPMLIPSGPGTVWVDSGDSNDSRRIARPKIATYLGRSAMWRNRDGNGEAEALIEVPDAYAGGWGYGGVAKWVFKSVDQGRDGHQGDAPRAVAFDEEPLDPEVVEECTFRVVDEGGRLFFLMTPLYGWTALLNDRVREVRTDTVVRYISGEDNPHQNQTALAMSLNAASVHMKEARAHGRVTTAVGLVYPFDRAVHVVPSFTPPLEWPRYLSIDFGTRNPACWLWGAVDGKDDVLHVWREHYAAGMTIKQHVAHVTGLEVTEANLPAIAQYWRDQNFAGVVADPEDLDARLELAELGLETTAANKAIRHGIDVVSGRMAQDANGNPHVVYHDCVVNLIREKEGYRWPKSRPGAVNDGTENPVKKDDHAMDALRYLCVFINDSQNDPIADVGGLDLVAASEWRI